MQKVKYTALFSKLRRKSVFKSKKSDVKHVNYGSVQQNCVQNEERLHRKSNSAGTLIGKSFLLKLVVICRKESIEASWPSHVLLS